MQENVKDIIKKESETLGKVVVENTMWEKFKNFLEFKLVDFTYGTAENAHEIVIKVKFILLITLVIVATTYILRWIKRIFTKHMSSDDKAKFNTIFSFSRWIIYLVVVLIAFDAVGVNVTAIFAASAALLIGVGFALQTLFQDIISGIFILVDKSVHVGDIIEIEDKVGRVEEIKLRTTRAVTIDNKVLVIPNHLYLTNSLYNWTQNGTITRESIQVGVAYGSDVQLVKKILKQAASTHPDVLSKPEPVVIFSDFGESALDFKIIFTINDSFKAQFPKSDIRFEIDKLFRENNITIPFPQRDLHIIKK